MASGIRADLPGRPYIDTFVLKGGAEIMGQREFTAVVVDSDEYDVVMVMLLDHPPGNAEPGQWEESVAKMKWLRNIPAIGKGRLTEWLFTRYDVKTNVMGLMVRGEGQNVVAKMGLTS